MHNLCRNIKDKDSKEKSEKRTKSKINTSS